jgi:hypothetical protein
MACAGLAENRRAGLVVYCTVQYSTAQHSTLQAAPCDTDALFSLGARPVHRLNMAVVGRMHNSPVFTLTALQPGLHVTGSGEPVVVMSWSSLLPARITTAISQVTTALPVVPVHEQGVCSHTCIVLVLTGRDC